MLIWVVAGEYPTARRPHAGPFVRDQVEALRALGHEVVVIHHDPPTLRRAVSEVRARVGRRSRAVAATQPSPRAADAVPEAADPASARPVRSTLRWLHDTAGRGWAAAAMVRDMRRLARTARPDVVHAHNVWPAGVAARRWRQEAGTPYVVTEHTSSFLRHQLVERELAEARRVLADAGAVLAVSSAQAEALPAPDVAVVPNVVDTTVFALREPAARERGPVVTIGRLVPMKGMAAVVGAWAGLPEDLRRQHPLVVVGAGPEEATLRALAPEGVTFTGHLLPDAVAALLGTASLLVSASRVETFGVTLIEALAAGVPFVATQSGGPQDIWFPDAGTLVPLHHTDADLTAAIAAALGDLGLQAADASRRAQALSRFGPAAVASRLVAVYEQVRA